jgi:ABC-type multidrug transport system ATPase subunit
MGERSGVRVRADGLALRGSQGWVLTGVTFDARPGDLVSVVAGGGSGRTSLLLMLGGRMRPTSGTASVDGLPLPRRARQVQRVSALGEMETVNELDDAVSVGAHVAERAHLVGWFARRRTIDAALRRVDLDLDHRTLVRELDTFDRRLLGVALALMGEPRLILVDDADDRLTADVRPAMWERLAAVAESGPTVVAAGTDAPPPGLAAAEVRLGPESPGWSAPPRTSEEPATEDTTEAETAEAHLDDLLGPGEEGAR